MTVVPATQIGGQSARPGLLLLTILGLIAVNCAGASHVRLAQLLPPQQPFLALERATSHSDELVAAIWSDGTILRLKNPESSGRTFVAGKLSSQDLKTLDIVIAEHWKALSLLGDYECFGFPEYNLIVKREGDVLYRCWNQGDRRDWPMQPIAKWVFIARPAALRQFNVLDVESWFRSPQRVQRQQ